MFIGRGIKGGRQIMRHIVLALATLAAAVALLAQSAQGF